MQTITIAGTIGKNAELRRAGDKPVAGFSVAVSNGKDRDGNWKDSTWYDCSLWGKRGESLAQYLTKGSRVCVTGRPSVRVHEGKAYLGVSVNEVSLLGKSEGGGQNTRGDYQNNQDTGYGSRSDARNDDRSEPYIPF